MASVCQLLPLIARISNDANTQLGIIKYSKGLILKLDAHVNNDELLVESVKYMVSLKKTT